MSCRQLSAVSYVEVELGSAALLASHFKAQGQKRIAAFRVAVLNTCLFFILSQYIVFIDLASKVLRALKVAADAFFVAGERRS